MADNNPITQGDGTGGTLALDEISVNGQVVKVQLIREVFTSITSDRRVVTTAGTRVQLKTSATPARRCEITAETDNTGVIVVGGADCVAAQATREGTPLNPGDTMTIAIDDLSKIYLDSTVSGDGVTFNYFS